MITCSHCLISKFPRSFSKYECKRENPKCSNCYRSEALLDIKIKQCSKCKEFKSIEDFSKRNSSLDGRQKQCRKCISIKNEKWIVKTGYREKQKLLKYGEQKAKRAPRTKIERKLYDRIRLRIHRLIRKIPTSTSASELLGCSLEEFKSHLESKWLPGMSWENYGQWKRGQPMTWHIDHIKPVSWFDFTNIEELKTCCHWTNTQPMWALDNLKKNAYFES